MEWFFSLLKQVLGNNKQVVVPPTQTPSVPEPTSTPTPSVVFARRRITKEGLELIKSFEGLRLETYLCPANIPTIGYGSTGSHVKMGMKITETEAEDLLIEDLERFEVGVEKLCKVQLSDNEFSALVSFSFNVGLGALEKSTLLKVLNSGDKVGAAPQFLRWNKAGGKVLNGLTKRREAEMKLFLKA
jgi:lysozyme